MPLMCIDKETGPDGRQVNGGEVDRLSGKMEKESETWWEAERENG